MNRLTEIQEQIARLKDEEQLILNQNRETELARVKEIIALYGFTAGELGIKARQTRIASGAAPKPASVPKYRNPKDPAQTWAGTRGPQPGWVKEHLAAGGTLEQLLIQG